VNATIRILSATCLVLWLPPFTAAQETSVEIARGWWPELTNVVTPVAWRDHPHRFCVMYDGTVLAMPDPQQLLRYERENSDLSKKPHDGVQLGFIASADGAEPAMPDAPYTLAMPDGKRVGDQGWLDHPAPVLWTRWKPSEGPMAGFELRQLMFAHMAGGKEAVRGDEPMFAWIRLEIAERPAGANKGAKAGLLITISAPHMDFAMQESENCRVLPQASRYPRKLHFKVTGSRDAEHLAALLTEEDGRVRLGLLPARARLVAAMGDHSRHKYLHVELAPDARHVDLLLPMVPVDEATFDAEAALGRDGALAQVAAFWSADPPTAARVHTPEPLINGAILNSVRMARMMTLTLPKTKERSLLSGAMFYSYLWPTPTSMTKHMLLDPFGWHGDVDKYLEIYRKDQGRNKAPGPDFPQHPGYFGVPASLDSGNHWLTDHGSVLYTASRHALLSGNEEFIRRWLEPILKGCDFIKQARQLPRKGAAAPPGVMPPAEASDVSKPIQAFWSDAWNYKALVTAARLLRVIQHPRAEEFEREAADYREAIAQALRAKAARQPRWTDAAGRQRPIVPMTLTTDDTDGLGHEHPFYLDTGPMFGVYAGVLPADDPLMRDAADFLREGPHAQNDKKDRSWSDPPRLIHEMSSAEPCYSWNIFHSHQLGDRQRYLEGMYSIFTGAMSRQTYVSCETRGGITDNVFSATLALTLARLAVVDDELEPDHLHLLRLTPLAWVSAKEQTRFENMPTEFGPVTVKWQLTEDGKTLNLDFNPKFRRQPKAVILHVPPSPGLSKLIVNGTEHAAEAGKPIKL
jgi:hypothetical protein